MSIHGQSTSSSLQLSTPMEAAATISSTETEKTPFQQYQLNVESNPLDFNSWVQLLALIETDSSIAQNIAENTFDHFLSEFPLCFGYWNKYAQYEYGLSAKTNPSGELIIDTTTAITKANEVYERGVIAVKYSVDMWMKYIEFLIVTAQAPVADIRSVLDRAIDACGNDPLAGALWEYYIQVETRANDMNRLNRVFHRILKHPLTNLEAFWEKYNQFVLAQPLSILASADELRELVKEGEDDMDEGLLRVRLVEKMEAMKTQTMQIVSKRHIFEVRIDRTYFHVTQLPAASLLNWHKYLDFEENQGNNRRCEDLYERCLVVCANYEPMWLRYANWKEKTMGFDAANHIFQRAVSVYLKYRSSIYLQHALFLESHGKIDEARSIYHHIHSTVEPSLAEGYLKYCHFERRQGNQDKAKNYFEKAIDMLESRSTNEPEVFAFMIISYAAFLRNETIDIESIRGVYERGVKHVTNSLVLWLNYIHFEISLAVVSDQKVKFVDRVSSIFSRAVGDTAKLSQDEKCDMWFQYNEFMEANAPSMSAVQDVRNREIAWKKSVALPPVEATSVQVLRLVSDGKRNAGIMNGQGVSIEATSVKRPRLEMPQMSTSQSGTPTYNSYGQSSQVYTVPPPQQNGSTPNGAPQMYTQEQYAAYYQQ